MCSATTCDPTKCTNTCILPLDKSAAPRPARAAAFRTLAACANDAG
jgi:hypothetical protein